VLVVQSFDELDARGAAARGKIVLFNVPFTNYGETVRFRSGGPSRAARHGAVAMLIRAVGPAGLRTPHTGALQYASDVKKIPAAAISAEDADRLQRMTDRGNKVVVRLKMEGHFEADAESANVVGEIRGRERPDEVVVVSGHLDSWDVGAGATDDGGGCVVTWEALRIRKKLNLRPRRTVRVVLWTNEENGGRGVSAYRDQHRAELARHVMMLESDGGAPAAQVGFTGTTRVGKRSRRSPACSAVSPLIRGYPGGGGADIGPSMQEAHPGDVARSRRLEILPDPPHARRHDRQDRSRGDGQCAAARGGDACRRGDLPHRLGE
jgi:carboxypeptidase Q